MSTSDDYPEKDRPVAAWCDLQMLHIKLKDGRQISNPLWWYPNLLAATPPQRNNIEYMWDGLHWPDLDEDISVDGAIGGRKARDAVEPGKSSAEAA